MKKLFISDLHLSTTFDQSRYKFLCNLVKNYNQIYILGDLFEGYKNKPIDVVNSEWGGFFKILKTKNTYMFLGNHDNCNIRDLQNLNLFKCVYNNFILKIEDKIFYLCHGQKYYKSLDLIFRAYWLPIWTTKILLKVYGFEKNTEKKAQKYKKSQLSLSCLEGEKSLIKPFKLQKGNKLYLLAGHTHTPKFDLKNKYINTGFINYGFASYLVINDIGGLEYKIESY